ncbi:pre-rRNA processing protein [Allomyces arbusculus]|nr:pre-rRNA processing protein [Allomyces arbusculus]
MAKDSFFLSDGGGPAFGGNAKTARKRPAKAAPAKAGGKPSKKAKRDEELASDNDTVGSGDDIDRNLASDDDDAGSDDDRDETAAEKRLRLAKAYIDQVKSDAARRAEYMDMDMDDSDDAEELISGQLRDSALEAKGRLWRHLARQYTAHPPSTTTKFPRGHQLAVTCVAATPDCRFIFTGGKDGTLIKWNAATMAKEKVVLGLQKKAPASVVGHAREINCLAVSSKYVATGGNDGRINIWTVDDVRHVRAFTSHRDAVTGLVFRRGSACDLYSSSRDRTVKTWNLDEMTYVETLFGHQEAITAIDALSKERCVTAGGRDKTMRLWKIIDEAQLVFRGSQTTHGSLDCVYLVTDDLFVSGDDNGTLSLWSTNKKKAVHSVKLAHGTLPRTPADDEAKLPSKPYWVTALAGIKFSDLFFSASWSGEVKCWRIDKGSMTFSLVSSVTVPGCVNGLSVVEPVEYPPPCTALDDASGDRPRHVSDLADHGITVYAATGQEHKDGRWWKVQKARNVVYSVRFTPVVDAKPNAAPVGAAKAKGKSNRGR